MKFLLLTALTLVALTSNAFGKMSYGKYKLETPQSASFDASSVVFLLNYSAETKIIDNFDYYTIQTNLFFTDLEMTFKSGGDEDFFLGKAVFNDGELKQLCFALIDLPNETIMTYSNSFKLFKWNTKSKSYDLISNNLAEKEQSACFESITAEYKGFNIH